MAATGRCNVLRSRGSAMAGVPSRHPFPTRGRCAGGASGAGPVHLSGLAGSRSRARRRGGESRCLQGCRGWAAVGGHTVSPLPRHSLAAGLPWEMALAQHCSAAGQLGPAWQGGEWIQAAGSAAPPGVPLCSPLLPSFPPSACRSRPAPPPRAHGRLRSGWRYGSLSKPIRRN